MELATEHKNIIYYFYKKNRKTFDLKLVDLQDDTDCIFFMWNLECELGNKDYHKELNKYENELFLILLKDSKNNQNNYSDVLKNIFKNTLKNLQNT